MLFMNQRWNHDSRNPRENPGRCGLRARCRPRQLATGCWRRTAILRDLVCVLAICGGVAAVHGETIKLKAKPGSTVRIDGTSTVHDWTVEGSLIGGNVEVQGDFPVEPGRQLQTGQVDAKVHYEDWLRTQSRDIQDTVLGKTKAAAWRSGKLGLDDMVDAARSRVLTLEELRSKGLI